LFLTKFYHPCTAAIWFLKILHILSRRRFILVTNFTFHILFDFSHTCFFRVDAKKVFQALSEPKAENCNRSCPVLASSPPRQNLVLTSWFATSIFGAVTISGECSLFSYWIFRYYFWVFALVLFSLFTILSSVLYVTYMFRLLYFISLISYLIPSDIKDRTSYLFS